MHAYLHKPTSALKQQEHKYAIITTAYPRTYLLPFLPLTRPVPLDLHRQLAGELPADQTRCTSLHACMHACMHACRRACIHACIQAYICACMHQYIHASMYVLVNARMHARMHAYLHANQPAYIGTCMRTTQHFLYLWISVGGMS